MRRWILYLALAGACDRTAAARPATVAIDAGVELVDAGAIAKPDKPGPTCVKGCPCGNTCIACSKTCHVGAGTAKKRRR